MFHQRGDGSANVAVIYNFTTNSYQGSPNRHVNGNSFSVAFWYRSTQSVPPVTGRYIRSQALSEINGNPWTAVAKTNVLGQ